MLARESRVDADIKGFFDHIDHDWMMKFVSLYIKDPNVLWLIKSYLKVGVIDNEKNNRVRRAYEI